MPSSAPIEARWYLIQCKARQDARAYENLHGQGFRCYRPTRIVERLSHGRRRWVVESLLPGYLFIQLDRVNDNWHPICSTRGVSCVVCFRGEPVPVADEIVAAIRRRLAEAPCDLAAHIEPAGRAMKSPGNTLEGIFDSADGQVRVTQLLSVLQERTLNAPLAGAP